MEKQKKYKIYRMIMIVALTAFITFMITSISLYTYFTKNPLSISLNTSGSNKLAVTLEKYKEIINKYYLG